jgi:hypothetical protein
VFEDHILTREVNRSARREKAAEKEQPNSQLTDHTHGSLLETVSAARLSRSEGSSGRVVTADSAPQFSSQTYVKLSRLRKPSVITADA